ncbi:MAG TPA: ATP-binding cassette domain-containing protein, partial [Holophaga sp.]|nr:ATP-binding cassette domain-containing protein [Holophaga sp.]
MAQRTDIKIECKGVSKSFVMQQEVLRVLDDVTLTVHENEFLVILGPGQGGKTTLLNCIGGLLSPDSGEILLNGRPVTGPGTDRGIVFQQYALFPWKTVEDNVAFGLAMKGVDKAERLDRARHYIDLVGLAGFEKAYPAKLSGGMK